MSKEKECKCCHEWWYASDIKEDLCPNCYDYFKQLKQQLAEKDKEIEDCKRNELYEENMKILAVKNQTQLAIQELEKVKELLLDEYKKYPIVYDKTNDIVAGALDRDKVNEIIDQQIKEIKGEKE